MESNDVFETSAQIEILNTSGLRQTPSSKGAEVSTSARDEISSLEHDTRENQPLLGQTAKRIYGDATVTEEPDSGDGREDPSWPGEHDFEGLPWWRTPSIWWLLPPFAIFTTAFGGTMILRINLILSLICRQYCSDRSMMDPTFHVMPVLEGDDNPQCRIPEVQALVSKFSLYGSLLSGITSGIISPKLGALSDRYGRLRMMAVTTVGMVFSEAIFIIVASYPDMLSVNWILLGYLLDGLGGSFTSSMALSYAYASDCTPPPKRNVIFGYYQGCLFGGVALGPLFGGYVTKITGNILTVFYFSLAGHGAFLIWLLFVVPESLSKERQYAAQDKKRLLSEEPQWTYNNDSWHLISTVKRVVKGWNLLAPLAILWPKAPGTNLALRRNLFFLAAVDTTVFGVAMGSVTVVIIYSNYKFGWGTFETNVFVSIIYTCRVSVLIVVLPLITRLIRGPRSAVKQRSTGCDLFDLSIIRFAIFFDLLGYIGYATVRSGPLFIACGTIAALGGMGSPTLQSSLTKHVPPDRIGQVLGAMGLLHASARVVAPTIFNLIYAVTIGNFDQAVFICLAATFGLSFALAWCIRPNVSWEDTTQERHVSRNGEQIMRDDHINELET